MSSTYARVQNIDFQSFKRVIAVSDIHGDMDGFSRLLQQLRLTDEDALVIVGDMIEKGEHSLDVLHLVMELSQNGTVFPVMGNNEAFLLEWYEGAMSDKEMFGYVVSHDKGLLPEMAQQIRTYRSANSVLNPQDLPLFRTPVDLTELRAQINRYFSEEMKFLQSLPQILDSDLAVFVHAGLKPGPIGQQDYWYCLSAPAFAQQTHVFEKPVVVGHWPVSNYCDTIICVNAHVSQGTNVISIDGGNSMKAWAQINYLIFDLRTEDWKSGFCDTLPKIRVLDTQNGSPDPQTLVFPNTQIELREKKETESLCFVPCLKKEMIIANDRIYDYKGKTYCYDFTTYDLPVTAGEVLSFCGETPDGILVKREGIVGNYRGRYEFM